MKGEYFDQQPNKNNDMFSKQQHHHIKYPFRECHQTSEEDDSGAASPKLTSPDGEVFRRPRGRPPGSKNKPKPPVVITRDAEPAMSPYVIEVPGGNDVVETISRFCRRKGIGLCVLSGSGTVANVTLRQPSTTPGGTVTFHGRFDILSISATVLPPATSYPVPNGFTISLGGPQGQIVGGPVAGPLLAAGTVYVIAATLNSPSYHRLPAEDEVLDSGSAGGGDGDSQQADSRGMYSSHLPPDVMWARQGPPY